MAQQSPKPLRIGVLYEKVQLSDITGIDVLGNCSIKNMEVISALWPEASVFKPVCPDMQFLYIASSMEPIWTTPEMYIRPTHTYETAPRDLDIILMGGPNPFDVPEASLKFLREASVKTKAILTTCTGGAWLARSGVLDGKKATTNRLFLREAAAAFPTVEWVDQRWVSDKGCFEGAEIWTAGGAGCGIDMVIEYALKTLDKNLVKFACAGLEFVVEGRNQAYAEPLRSPF